MCSSIFKSFRPWAVNVWVPGSTVPVSLQEGLALWALQRAAKAGRPGSQAPDIGRIHLHLDRSNVHGTSWNIMIIMEPYLMWIHSDPFWSKSIRFWIDLDQVFCGCHGAQSDPPGEWKPGHIWTRDVVLCCLQGTKITTPHLGLHTLSIYFCYSTSNCIKLYPASSLPHHDGKRPGDLGRSGLQSWSSEMASKLVGWFLQESSWVWIQDRMAKRLTRPPFANTFHRQEVKAWDIWKDGQLWRRMWTGDSRSASIFVLCYSPHLLPSSPEGGAVTARDRPQDLVQGAVAGPEVVLRQFVRGALRRPCHHLLDDGDPLRGAVQGDPVKKLADSCLVLFSIVQLFQFNAGLSKSLGYHFHTLRLFLCQNQIPTWPLAASHPCQPQVAVPRFSQEGGFYVPLSTLHQPGYGEEP